MSFGARIAIAVILLVIGVASIAVTVTLELTGAPPWLHFVSWIGGGLSAAGIGSLANAIRWRRTSATG